MKYTITSLAIAGFAALASAAENAFIVPTSGFAPVAGQDIQLQWDATAGKTVTLVLRSGASNDLKEGSPIAEKIDNTGSYTWSVPKDTVRGSDYTIEIINDDDPTETNYYPYFVLESTVTVASTTSTYTYGAATTTPSATSVKASSTKSSSDDESSTLATSTKSSSASASASASASGSSSSSSSRTASSSESTSTSTSTQSASGNAPTSGAAANRVIGGGLALLGAACAFFIL
ncbi:GPI anchored cell wall protein [Lasiodiplodia theobromae]|uniref:Putative cell wall protein n=1 Tax=Lasiodiplodia theobromae TaxID=45133 RepID=A0A5N5D5D8_9PEZI|nr:GPI anchored cell wall protein [Lasiodiplodia theobromae]KAB2572564.1 putative cell wall protein [Lasiodiplodia theobromae]KAF4536004.1 GPI anchored cell wall protein [Lasiodiplodia theobromae]